ncbi:hypothetical protein I3760_13G085100 [Carya illinoinensis]|nr:hypothetical protein I3760_13G085100 [Carya illinoinensis]
MHGQGTCVGFYLKTCPQAESIIRLTVQTHFGSNPTIAPGLLRMHFHNCFVHGCDASILIKGTNIERTTPPNSLLRGFEVIDDAKAKLKATCPGIVSCAVILALTARDSVFLILGGVNLGGPNFQQLVSEPLGLHKALKNRPTPEVSTGISVTGERSRFKMSDENCENLDLRITSAIRLYKLYNFTTSGKGDDPTIDPTFLPQRRALYPPNGDGTKRVGLDHGSQNTFDTSYFNNLRNDRGVLKSDQRLWTDANTKTFVQRFLGANAFNVEFGRSMVKMSNVDVKTGTQGEIRKICSAIN